MMLFHRSHKRKMLLSIIIIIFVILIIGGLWNWHLGKVHKLEDRIKELEKKPLDVSTPNIPDEHQPVPVSEQTKSYTNTTFNYTLDYPDNLQIKNYNNANATIGIINNSGSDEYIGGKVNMAVITAKTNADNKMTLEKFIFNNTKLLCDADGGGVSVSCPRQKDNKALALTSGLPAYTLTLEREEKTIGPEASTSKSEAVFFVVNLGTDQKKSILILYPVGDGTIELAKQVAQSVRQ